MHCETFAAARCRIPSNLTNPAQPTAGDEQVSPITQGIIFGTALGAALGAAMDNVGTGIAIGIAVGVAIGASREKKDN